MKQLNEHDKLKYWLDAEISITRIGIALILNFMVTEFWQHCLLIIYIIFKAIYASVRLVYLMKHAPNYLKVPK